jgi:hypothetical protein
MDVDSDSDKFLSDDDLYDDGANKKGKGKTSSKKTKDKGKGKATEVSRFVNKSSCADPSLTMEWRPCCPLATVCMGGILYAHLGDCARG